MESRLYESQSARQQARSFLPMVFNKWKFSFSGDGVLNHYHPVLWRPLNKALWPKCMTQGQSASWEQQGDLGGGQWSQLSTNRADTINTCESSGKALFNTPHVERSARPGLTSLVSQRDHQKYLAP